MDWLTLTLLTATLLSLAPCHGAIYKDSLKCSARLLKGGRVRIRSRGRVAKYVCLRGYQVLGDKYSTCIRGKWDTPVPVCISGGCLPIDVLHGQVLETYRGALVTVHCDPGYSLIGTQSLYCNGAVWNDTVPVCREIKVAAQKWCDFESEDLCGWTHDANHDFDWRRHNFATPSGHVGTGPSFDHTLGRGLNGHYMYLETSSPRLENDTARLFSPIFSTPTNPSSCFIFWYHMFGLNTGSLNIYLHKQDTVLLFSQSGDHGNLWQEALIPLPPIDSSFQIVVEGVRGSGYDGDIAVDDVKLAEGEECMTSSGTIEFRSTTPALPTSTNETRISKWDHFSYLLTTIKNISITTVSNTKHSGGTVVPTATRQPQLSFSSSSAPPPYKPQIVARTFSKLPNQLTTALVTTNRLLLNVPETSRAVTFTESPNTKMNQTFVVVATKHDKISATSAKDGNVSPPIVKEGKISRTTTKDGKILSTNQSSTKPPELPTFRFSTSKVLVHPYVSIPVYTADQARSSSAFSTSFTTVQTRTSKHDDLSTTAKRWWLLPPKQTTVSYQRKPVFTVTTKKPWISFVSNPERAKPSIEFKTPPPPIVFRTPAKTFSYQQVTKYLQNDSAFMQSTITISPKIYRNLSKSVPKSKNDVLHTAWSMATLLTSPTTLGPRPRSTTHLKMKSTLPTTKMSRTMHTTASGYIANIPSGVPENKWKSKYKPRDEMPIHAQYAGPIPSSKMVHIIILVFCVLLVFTTVLITVCIVWRRRINRRSSEDDELDIRFLASDEILDFTLARASPERYQVCETVR